MMKTKIGRNTPCHCGSGKKHKHCCLISMKSFKEEKILDIGWHKIRQLEKDLILKHLIPYISEELDDTIIPEAFKAFFPNDISDDVFDDLLLDNWFMPWVFFNWIPSDNFSLDAFDSEKTIAENYLKSHNEKLNSMEQRFLQALLQTFYSFYKVLEVKSSQLIVVKDLLLGTTHTIKEHQEGSQLKRDHVLFTRILTFDDQSIFIGTAPFLLPTFVPMMLIDFKEHLIKENRDQALNGLVLRDLFDDDLFGFFFSILEAAHQTSSPLLKNTDSHPMQFSKSYFKLTLRPEEALTCLLPLTLSKDADQFSQSAHHNTSGELTSIKIPWLKKSMTPLNNTVMGQITLKNNRVILETNSQKRTEKGKKLLTKYLGESIVFQKTVIESPEQKLESLSKSVLDTETIQMTELPEEARAELQVIAKSHWDNWLNQPNPALNDKTPREAAKTEKDRQRLEALLLQYERYDLEQGDHPLKADMKYLKTELGLIDIVQTEE